MNLQPIAPARHFNDQRLVKACTNCSKDVMTTTGFADLDGPPFKAYLCVHCVCTFHLRHGQVVEALEARDRKELAFYPGRYALAGRVA